MVQILEMFLDKYLPALYNALGVFLPLITVNCAIMGAALFMVERDYNFGESVFTVRVPVSAGRWRLLLWRVSVRSCVTVTYHTACVVWDPFITVGLMSLGFMSFSGVQL